MSTSIQPRISIVMPAYNVAPYIGETLESVFAQTFDDYEVIVVNDGSPDTDELERVLEPYEDRIHYIKQENRGAGAARNEALRAARGDLIAFLDADDLWLPDYLSEQVQFLQGGNFDLVYADALLFGDSPLAGRTFMETAPSTGEVTFLSLITHRCAITTSGVLARRQLIFEVGLFDESLRNSQDFDLWLRLVRHGGRASFQKKVLLKYRCRKEGLSGDEVNRIARQIRVYKKIQDSYDLTPEEQTEVSRVMEKIKALHELELSKAYLAQGRFVEARVALNKANRHQRSWKLRGVGLILMVAPHLLRRLHAGRA